ncbi:MAG: radical SAM protein [Nanoarchaeota archaeon]|nr:radical SAM protein [Nanoarchaeota archaeon]
MRDFSNKRINKIKLTLTTECNLSCPYCFVNKTNEDMSWEVAKKAIGLLIRSKGKNKLLSLYGGEPLLRFDLIKRICPYAIKLADNKNKNLTISICTNLTLLKKEHLDLFRKYNMKVIVSHAGEKKIHNKIRFFRGGGGTYEQVSKKLSMLFDNIKQENIGVSFCILPETVSIMEKEFLYLIGLSFRYFNFEIIRDYKPWKKESIMDFRSGYGKIVSYILENIGKNNFLFLNPVNWEIAHQRVNNLMKASCPFNYLLEVYPDGNMAFSPFLLNVKNKEKHIIGNIKENKVFAFGLCSFSDRENACKSCIIRYFSSYKSDKGADSIHNVCNKLSLKAVKNIMEKSKRDDRFKDYIMKIKKGFYF